MTPFLIHSQRVKTVAVNGEQVNSFLRAGLGKEDSKYEEAADEILLW